MVKTARKEEKVSTYKIDIICIIIQSYWYSTASLKELTIRTLLFRISKGTSNKRAWNLDSLTFSNFALRKENRAARMAATIIIAVKLMYWSVRLYMILTYDS